jgi:D-sedoheptulose 7-phosphate isomerase
MSQPNESFDRYVAWIRKEITGSAELKVRVAEFVAEKICRSAILIADCFRAKRKLLICGNGGSAADSQHMAAEFVNRLSGEIERPGLPAIALTTDTSFLTAYSNDFGYEGIFERQVEALGSPGDVLLVISTSGNSPNLVRAVQAARREGLQTIGLLGEGGVLTDLVDESVVVPSRNTQHIQESFLSIEHTICGIVEQLLFASGPFS